MNLNTMKHSLFSGLAYGIGLGLGNLLSAWIFNNLTFDGSLSSNTTIQLLLGVVLAFLIAGLGGAFGGFIGGATLKVVNRTRSRWGYGFKSAIVFGIGYGWILFPVGLIISLISFYNVQDIRASLFGIIFAIVGALFGAINGLLLGLLTVGGRRTWRVVFAGLLGFGIGGLGFGWGLHKFIYSLHTGDVTTGQEFWLVLGLLFLGLFGGSALGFAYQRMAMEQPSERALVHTTWLSRRRYLIVSVILILLVIFFRPILNTVRQTLTPAEAQLSSILQTNTIGTHWSPFNELYTSIDPISQPDIFSIIDGGITIVWAKETATDLFDLYMLNGHYSTTDHTIDWGTPTAVYDDIQALVSPLQVVVDRTGKAHILWSSFDQTRNSKIFYVQCQNGSCSEAIDLTGSIQDACAPPTSQNLNLDMAINGDNIMAVWQNDAGALPFIVWSADAQPPSASGGCILADELEAHEPIEPQLAKGPDTGFSLIFRSSENAEDSIHVAQYLDGDWQIIESNIGNGQMPAIYIDPDDHIHAAWCGSDGGVQYWYAQETTIVSITDCLSRPVLAQDELGAIHVTWYSDQVENPFGQINPSALIYESIQKDPVWTPPVVITLTNSQTQPGILNDDRGRLHLVWADQNKSTFTVYYANQEQYNCQDYPLIGIQQAIYQVSAQEKYRPNEQLIPYCRNQYEQLIHTPNPNNAFSDQNPHPDGAFGKMAELIQNAEYEVLFATMWYDEAKSQDSPGMVIAESVASLFQQLKAHPERYPRGLTVRILLGNPPEFAAGGVSNQIWYVLSDLREAGIDKMTDLELGWSLEVANFAGSMPHSHVKTLIIDGRTVVSAGYNMTYNHYAPDHPSGLGNGRNDLGVQLTGPVAQDSMVVFDDLWAGAHRRHCSDLRPAVDQTWQATCFDFPARTTHVPEVLRYYLPDENAIAFSMYRSIKRDEADQQILTALRNAQESIDTIQVNFTLELICDLNVLYDLCSIQNSLPYLDALLSAAEDNGAHVRILVKPGPIEGIENTVALDVLLDTIESRGLSEWVEIRLFDGDVHYKTNLIDEQFLIVGSQNFHYSAFGEGAGLAEYNLGTDSPKAIDDFKRLFEYHWEKAERIEP